MKHLIVVFSVIILGCGCSSSKRVHPPRTSGPIAGTANRPDTTARTPSARIAPGISSAPVPNPKPLPPAPNPPQE